MRDHIYVLGGGTFNHVRNHMSLAAPAFGETARILYRLLENYNTETPAYAVSLILTKMADHGSVVVSNVDVSNIVKGIIADSSTKVVFFNVALCDFEGSIGDVPSGKHAERLKTRDGGQAMDLTPAAKLVGKIKAARPDIFLIAFKTTCGATEADQLAAGLNLLETNSCNLVLANDTRTRNNMVIFPEKSYTSMGENRIEALEALVQYALLRSGVQPMPLTSHV